MVNQPGADTLPPIDLADPAELFGAFLDFYRDAALRKIDGLSEAESAGKPATFRLEPARDAQAPLLRDSSRA